VEVMDAMLRSTAAMSSSDTVGRSDEFLSSARLLLTMAMSSRETEGSSVRFLWSAGEAGEGAGRFLDVWVVEAVESVVAVEVLGGKGGVACLERGRGDVGTVKFVC